MKKQVFVIGIDEFNFEMLHSFDKYKQYDYHSILDISELQHQEKYPMDDLMGKAVSAVDSFDIAPDAIVGFWNFPVTCITPLLARKYNLPHLPVDALIKCEHKYFGRKEQRKYIPDNIPDFNLINPNGKNPFDDVDIDFPFWLKPVVSFASQLCFKVHNRKEFDKYLSIIKENIHRFADPINYVLKQTELPGFMKDIDGYYCIAEETIQGKQCTIEGQVHNGKIGYTGVFDSLRHPDHETFYSYEYPSVLDKRVIDEMKQISSSLLTGIGYDNSCFNIEFFYDDESDHLWLLEINPRISQSHSDPFLKVDGAPNHKPMVEVALGEEPALPSGEGDFNVAAKFYYRAFDDGIITNVPDMYDLDNIRKIIPDMKIKIWVDEGTRLSEMYDQDSYSYKLASVYLGAKNKEELYEKRDRCFDLLNFKIDSIH